jgi:hypothetical protein
MNKKLLLTAAFVWALLFSFAVGTLLVNLVVANPVGHIKFPSETPVLSVLSPANVTYNVNNVSLTVNVTKPVSWNSTSSFEGLIFAVGYYLDNNTSGAAGGTVSVGDEYSTKFLICSINLTGLSEGTHSLAVYSDGICYLRAEKYHNLSSKVVIGYSEPIYFVVDTPPQISILSLENATYETADVSFNFTINQPVSQIMYSLDGKDNVTVAENAENITLNGLFNGLHSVTVYAWDIAGNVGVSETINFTIAEEPAPEPFPTALVATASGTSAAVAGVGILVCFRKRKR